MSEKKVQILIATYNGEKYLEEQLNSILNQTYTNWEVLIRDDGSNDKTLNILSKYLFDYPKNFFIINDDLGNLGPCYNFLKLVEYSTSEYIFFCDQDDIWAENKLALFVESFEKAEKLYSKEKPLLLHSNLSIINQNKDIISPSYTDFMKLNTVKQNKLEKLLVRNFPGCSMAINRALINKTLPNPNNIMMHDLWFSLIACIFGKIIYLNEPLVSYKIHDQNTIGIGKNRGKTNINILNFIKNFQKKKKDFYRDTTPRIKQAELLLQKYKNILPNSEKNILSMYVAIKNQNFFIKRFNLIRFNFMDETLIRNLRIFFYS